MSENPERIKIFFLGEKGVGKTSIIYQFMRKKFVEDLQPTSGINITYPDLKFSNNETINLINYDVSGNEKYLKFALSQLDEFSFIVLVYKVDSKYTFEQLKDFWIKKLERKGFEKKIIAIVGNKCELIERDIRDAVAKKFADDNNVLFFNTTAKHSWSPTVNKLFEGIIKKIKGWEEEEGVKLIKIFPDGESNEEEEEKESLKKNQYYKTKKKKSGCC